MKNKSLFLFVLVFPIITLNLSHAAVNDSGSIISEQKQLGIERLTSSPPPDIKTTPPPELTPDSSITFAIKNFQFQGYESLISIAELQKLSTSYIKEDASYDDLSELTYKITKYLREEKGFLLSRAYLPEQDITQGTVTIAIIPVRLDGEVFVDNQSSVNSDMIRKIARKAIPADQTLLLQDVERAVLLISDLPATTARAFLDKGEAPGTSRISIETTEGRWMTGSLLADNFGNRYTGMIRRTAQAAFSNSLHQGDLLQVSYVNAEELNQGMMKFSMPLFSNGTSLDLSYAGFRYEVGGKLEDLRAKGSAHTTLASLRYPVRRTRKSSLWIGTAYGFDTFEDKLDSVVSSDRNVNTGKLFLTGNFYDRFASGGLTSFQLSLVPGSVDISDGESDDAAGAQTDGDFFKAAYSLARLQKISRNSSLLVSARGQFSNGNLDSSQKIILGGPTGVRAYPVGEASGDEGHILSLEHRIDLPFMPEWAQTQFFGFIDAGFIRLHKDTWTNSVTNISGKNHYWLTGAGPGFAIEKKGVYNLQFSYAHKIGKNVGRSTSDNDADNRHDDGRYWVQFTLWF